MDPAARLQANLNVLKRHDSTITEIVDRSSHVVVYQFKAEAQAWAKRNVEGTLFVFRRSIIPFYGFFIMNRLGVENIMCFLTEKVDLQITPEYIMYRTDQFLQPDENQVYGLWLFENRDRERLSSKLEALRGISRDSVDDLKAPAFNFNQEKAIPQPATESGVDVMGLLTKAFTSHSLKTSQDRPSNLAHECPEDQSRHDSSASAGKDGQFLLSLMRARSDKGDVSKFNAAACDPEVLAAPGKFASITSAIIETPHPQHKDMARNRNATSDIPLYTSGSPAPVGEDPRPRLIESENPSELSPRQRQVPNESGFDRLPPTAFVSSVPPHPDHMPMPFMNISENMSPQMLRMPPPLHGMPPPHFIPPPGGFLYPPHAAAAAGAAFASRYHGKPGGGPISRDEFIGALFHLMQVIRGSLMPSI